MEEVRLYDKSELGSTPLLKRNLQPVIVQNMYNIDLIATSFSSN